MCQEHPQLFIKVLLPIGSLGRLKIQFCLVFLRAQKYSKELVGDPSAGSPYHKNEPMFLFGVFQQENQLN